MKESYEEQLAIDFGHNPYAGSGDAPGVASSFAKATEGQVNGVRCGDDIKRFFHVFLGIQDRMVFGV